MSYVTIFNAQGAFFYCSAQKMTLCQSDREISELFLPKNLLRMKKIKFQNCSELLLLWWLIMVIEMYLP